jgi:DNA-3-methyladenine glycosylase II
VSPDDELRRDPVMAGLIDDHGGPLPSERDSRGRPDDLYGALVRSIAGQQLSVRAAAAIWNKLLARFDGRTPTPAEILADDPEALRAAAGFSRAKVAYLRSLAEHVESGALEMARIRELPDEEVIAELTAVKGIGEWTAQMFLMFTLHRPDVLPVGDLGVRNAARAAYGIEAPDELRARAEAWRPHRTRACLYLWRSLQNTPDA